MTELERASIVYLDALMNKNKNPLIDYIANGGKLAEETLYLVCSQPKAYETLICYVYSGHLLDDKTLIELSMKLRKEDARNILACYIERSHKNIFFSTLVWNELVKHTFFNDILLLYCQNHEGFENDIIILKHPNAEELLSILIKKKQSLSEELLCELLDLPYAYRVICLYIEYSSLTTIILQKIITKEYGFDILLKYVHIGHVISPNVVESFLSLPDDKALKIFLEYIEIYASSNPTQIDIPFDIRKKSYAKEIFLTYLNRVGNLPYHDVLSILPYDYAEDVLNEVIIHDNTSNFFGYKEILAVIQKPTWFNWFKLYFKTNNFFTTIRHFLLLGKK